MTLPRISIVTPSFNQAPWLERTMQSVLSQQYPALEYLLIDGGSTDASPDVIERYAASITRWERQRGQGLANGLNQGFAGSTGEVMGWLNADDVYLPHALHIVGQIFADYPQIQWLTSSSINISSDDRFFIPQSSRKTFSWWTQLAHRSPPPQHCTFWRRSLWERAGGYLEEGNRYMDCELWLRFYEHETLYVADTIFGAWRIHPDSYSTRRLRRLHQEIDAAQRRYAARYLSARLALRLTWPLLQTYLRYVDRGMLSRLLFEVSGRRARMLTYSLRTGRFVLGGDSGVLPTAWPMRIELPDDLEMVARGA